jgi:rRNA maturation endonuclease Nob1
MTHATSLGHHSNPAASDGMAQTMICTRCDTEYPVPAPDECDYCGVALAISATSTSNR